MAFSFFHILFAIISLGFLIFIHELGHYLIARRRGMKVEVFSIGFGPPIYSWNRDGVKWQICVIPCGGYVKIAGMQREGSREPHEIADGYYGKTPWERIQVSLAGPLVNIGFALLVFFAIWSMGGREKRFSEFTHRIGWVDPQSALYQKGVRPGDYIQKYDGKELRNFKDLLMASVMKSREHSISGYKIDSLTGQKTHFDYTLPAYEDPNIQKFKLSTIGVFMPASYLIYPGQMPAGSPMENSGILPGDRLVWVDGEPLFSSPQLSSIVNDSTAFLTVERGEEIFQTKAPRVHIDDLQMSAWQRGEIDDWQHEAGIHGKLQDLAFIPYSLSPEGRIENRLPFIDEQEQAKAFQHCQRCSYFTPLQEGDQILAVDGTPVSTSYEILRELQTSRVLVIVERGDRPLVPWKAAETEFEIGNYAALRAMAASIGSPTPIEATGNLRLLKPVTPKLHAEFLKNSGIHQSIEAIKDPQKRAQSLKALESEQKRFVLGLPLTDREVIYNPTPFQQLFDVLRDTAKTLAALVSGQLSPKYLAGPVGIVTVMQQSWFDGAKEAVFWVGLISLNLGIMNLLPIPVLDGGHIVFSLWEMASKRRIRAKTMERLLIPFVGLLIAFLIFVTYQDISRLFSKIF